MEKVKKDCPPGTYLYAVPVSGVRIAKNIGHEFRIQQVTLFSTAKFLRLRRYGLQFTGSRIRKTARRWIDETHTVAVLQISGVPEERRELCHRMVRDELLLLSSSRLGFRKRTRPFVVAPMGSQSVYDSDDIFIGKDVEWMRLNSTRVTADYLGIDRHFVTFQKELFFPRLMGIVADKYSHTKRWRDFLRGVALLAGKSQNSVELADAFLWNMVALDRLLLMKRESKRHNDAIVDRTKAFFGRCRFWTRQRMDEKIRNIYDKRCKLVHDGNRAAVNFSHLILSDEVLANLLIAIVHHQRHFGSKRSIMDFAERENAKETLGLKPRSRDWQFGYRRLRYTANDVGKHWAL